MPSGHESDEGDAAAAAAAEFRRKPDRTSEFQLCFLLASLHAHA